MTDFSEQRSCIKLCFELGKSATETLGVLRSIYGENALCRSKTFHWYSRFRDGQMPPGAASKDSTTTFNNSLKPNGKNPVKRRKTMENAELKQTHINNNYDAIEAQLNYVKMLMKLGKTPSETYTCMQALFGPSAISRIDLLQFYLKLEADEKLSNNLLPPIIKPPTKKQRTSLPQTAVHELEQSKPPLKRQSQSRVDLMTGGSYWHAPYTDEKENTSLTENQVCFMDHFMLSGDSGRDSYKIMLPKNVDGYQSDVYDSGVDRFVPLPVPVENLNRMHVMDGDCAKADIVAEKAPQLQLHSPAAAAANGHDAADAEETVKEGLKVVAAAMKEQPAVADDTKVEKVTPKTNGENLENGPVVNGSSDEDAELVTSDKETSDNDQAKTSELVNGDSKVVDDENEKKTEGDEIGDEDKMVVDEPKLKNGVEDGQLQMEVEKEEEKMEEESVVKKEEEEVEVKEEEKKVEVAEKKEVVEKKEEEAKEEGVGTVASEEEEERTSVTSSQNRKRRLADTNGDAENCDNEAEGEAEMEGEAEVEGEAEGEGSSSDSESGTKRQRVEVEGEDERERLVREYVERCTQSVEEMSRNADKLQREIGALGELARAKELEWNSILRLRKLKEEMLERLLRRRRQTMMLADNGLGHEWAADYKTKTNKPASNNHLMMVPIVSSSPGNSSTGAGGALSRGASSLLSAPDTTRLARLQRPILPKPQQQLIDQQNTVIGEGRQGPILDVKSIIADYRSRHPADHVPRRGRRQKAASAAVNAAAAAMVSSTRITGSPALMSMANMALCSGAHIRNNSQECATGQENSRPSSTDSTRSTSMQSDPASGTPLPAPGLNFKDVLVQFAKMSQPPVTSLLPTAPQKPNPHPPPPPPYPEVTLHPVPAPSPPTSSHSSSLLHGILTKSSSSSGPGSTITASSTTTSSTQHRPTTFSPTLARLLTAPERERGAVNAASHHLAASAAASHFRPPVNRVSISDLLTTSKKSRNEITITPVSSHSSHPKSKDGVVLLEDDPEETDSTDRLVIDESVADQKGGGDGGEGDGESVPECQGCQQRAAQFVCAGCGNQWYCSRECQVTAWEEHSEMCSG